MTKPMVYPHPNRIEFKSVRIEYNSNEIKFESKRIRIPAWLVEAGEEGFSRKTRRAREQWVGRRSRERLQRRQGRGGGRGGNRGFSSGGTERSIMAAGTVAAVGLEEVGALRGQDAVAFIWIT